MPAPDADPTDRPERPDLLDLVRSRCASVAAEASAVAIDPERLAAYASSLVDDRPDGTSADADPGAADAAVDPWVAPIGGSLADATGADEQRAALVITLDAVNFGSGYHPHVAKLPGLSGARTMATRWRTWAAERGAIRAEDLIGIGRVDAHRIFGQPETPELVELMGLFATALDELGRHVVAEHGGSFLALVASADGSAGTLVGQLAGLASYADVSRYRGMEVPFLKRAQITPADLHRAFAGHGPGAFADLDRLTAFADNLVPHVLRVDGVLRLTPELTATIDRGDLLVHGDEPEVELRACAVHAVELLRDATIAAGAPRTAADIDQVLWARGGGARYKAIPRPRARTPAY